MKRKIFLISPVRMIDTETYDAISAYVAKLEVEGAKVYWPYRDTDQTDPHGWTICTRNRSAILDADEIHVWYHFWHDKDHASVGSIFDFGMIFALIGVGWCKKVVIANPEAVTLQARKDFRNVLVKAQEEMEEFFALREMIHKSARHPSDL